MDTYPYMVSNNKIEPILGKVRSAAKPERLTIELLKKWGFPSSNDRAILRVLKFLGVIDENNGTPTVHYDHLRDQASWRYALADRIRDAYSELFAIDQNIHTSPEAEIKGALSRVTGKDETLVGRYYATFKTLASLAKFDRDANPKKALAVESAGVTAPPGSPAPAIQAPHSRTALHYNIQLHLPATTDVTVYNAIFKSLRDVLGI